MSAEEVQSDAQLTVLEDEPRDCVACGVVFMYTAEEQRFHQERGWPGPRRCPPCRELRRARPSKEERARLAATLGEQLGETEPSALSQLGRLCAVFSPEQLAALVSQTDAVEAAGGMWVEREERRRTRGGVFFVLAQQALTPEQRAAVFPPRTWSKAKRKAKRKAKPAVPTEVAGEAVEPVPVPLEPAQVPAVAVPSDTSSQPGSQGQQQGGVTVKVTLIGRPGRVIEKAGYVLTSMTGKPAPALPKGLPAPPQTPTVYTVYIALKQWRSVVEALADAEDVLIAEGYPAYDPELEGLAVFVTAVTTKKLQAAKRQQQAPGV